MFHEDQLIWRHCGDGGIRCLLSSAELDLVSGAQGHLKAVVPIWTALVHGRHASLALALVGTQPSFWSQVERGSDVPIRQR